jgi:hypothetical protein
MRNFSEKKIALIIMSLILAYLCIVDVRLKRGEPLRILKRNGQHLSVYTGSVFFEDKSSTYKLSDKPSLLKGIMHFAERGQILYRPEQADSLNNTKGYIYLRFVSNDKNLMHKIASVKGWGLTEVPFQLTGYYLHKVEDLKFDVSSSTEELFYPTELIVSSKRINLVEVK